MYIQTPPQRQLKPGMAAPQAGFSSIEVLIAMSVLVIAMLAGVTTLTSTSVLSQASDETSQAVFATQGAMEALKAAEFESVIQRFNDDPSDDPAGPGTAPGAHFAVAGLSPQEGDPEGMVGRIMLPLDSAGRLIENQDLPEFGLPRDLNGDGSIDGSDHRTDCILLPVLVRIEWTGRSGARSIEFGTILGSQQ